MGFIEWTAAVGGLLLIMTLISGWIHRGPITTFGIYLVAGIVCGPWVLNLLVVDVTAYAAWIGRITEIAMAASLFITGLKLRLPFKDPAWRMGIRLAFPAMVLTVVGVTVAVHLLTGFSWPLSLVFGAIVAPTDPVLASLISVNDARDDDNLRVALSSEAGMNDGTALPILMLAMAWLTASQPLSLAMLGRWALIDVVWALLGGLGIGYGLGRLISHLATYLKSSREDTVPNDFLALALIALSYAAAQSLDASGFLAAFAAGVGLRRTELGVITRYPPDNLAEHDWGAPAEALVNPNRRHTSDGEGPVKSVGLVVSDALSFGDTMERLFAAGIVLLLGVTLAMHWQAMGLLMAAIVFLIVRPVSVFVATIGTGVPRLHRAMIGWLGIRGIGSINYIAWAYTHGLAGQDAERMADMAFTLIVASVVVHGVSVSPLLSWRQTRITAAADQREKR